MFATATSAAGSLTNGAMEDEELVKKILKGNTKAYSLLITRYERLVFHMVSRVVTHEQDREELCQDIFIKIYESLEAFRFQSKLSTWIATISYRMAVNMARKKDRQQQHDDLDAVDYQLGHIDDGFEQKDFNKFVHQIIAQMPTNYRAVLTLFYLEGFSYPEIVEITGMPEGTVKNYLFRSRQKLKNLLEPHIGSEIHL